MIAGVPFSHIPPPPFLVARQVSVQQRVVLPHHDSAVRIPVAHPAPGPDFDPATAIVPHPMAMSTAVPRPFPVPLIGPAGSTPHPLGVDYASPVGPQGSLGVEISASASAMLAQASFASAGGRSTFPGVPPHVAPRSLPAGVFGLSAPAALAHPHGHPYAHPHGHALAIMDGPPAPFHGQAAPSLAGGIGGSPRVPHPHLAHAATPHGGGAAGPSRVPHPSVASVSTHAAAHAMTVAVHPHVHAHAPAPSVPLAPAPALADPSAQAPGDPAVAVAGHASVPAPAPPGAQAAGAPAPAAKPGTKIYRRRRQAGS